MDIDSLAQSYAKTGTLHHAYILEGEREKIRNRLLEFIASDLGHATSGNPDFHHIDTDVFSVDEARDLKESQSRIGAVSRRKVYVLACNTITREAQNALLKVFEEPTDGTHFFLLVPSLASLLPTLLSRSIVLKTAFTSETEAGEAARNFLSLSSASRLAELQPLLEKKDKEVFGTFLNALESVLKAMDSTPKQRQALAEIIRVRSYLRDRSSSLKLLAEHIALILP